MERKIPVPGQKYIHFQNRPYQIICVADYAVTREKLVVYQALSGDFGCYVMPLAEFLKPVDRQKYPSVRQTYVFEEADVIREKSETERIGRSLEINRHEIEIMDLDAEDAEEASMQEKESQSQRTEASVHAESQPQRTASVQEESQLQRTATVQAESQPQKTVTGQAESQSQKTEAEEEGQADPALLEFLDAETLEEKYNILISLRDRITDHMIDNIAVCLDVVIPEGKTDWRYQQLLIAVRTMQRYENVRLR